MTINSLAFETLFLIDMPFDGLLCRAVTQLAYYEEYSGHKS